MRRHEIMMKGLGCALALTGWVSFAAAQSVVNPQFSGVQTIQIPEGGPLIVSRVSVDRGRVRIETGANPRWGLSKEVILLLPDQKAVYQWTPGQTHATRSEVSGLLPLSSPAYLTVAVLFQREIMGLTAVWSRLADENLDGQLCEKYRITGLPPWEVIVHVTKATRLPVRVRFQPAPGYTQQGRPLPGADWTAVEQGPQSAELFAVPPNLKIVDMPKETMQWEKGKVPTIKPAETSPSTIVPVPSKPAQSAAATAPPKISIAAFLDAPLSLDRHPMDVGNCRLVEHWDTGFCYVYSHGLGKKISAPTDARCTERDELRKRMRQAIAEHYCD